MRSECPCGGQIPWPHVNLANRTELHYPGLREIFLEAMRSEEVREIISKGLRPRED